MAQHDLPNQIASLFNSERLSDVTVHCGEKSWHAHKAVICTQCDFFSKACEGQFKEAKTGHANVDKDDPRVVHALLKYLYTGDYKDDDAPEFGRSAAVFNVQVFALGEKYFAKSLPHLAAEKFAAAMRDAWNKDNLADAIEEWSCTTSDPDKILGNKIANIILGRAWELLNEDKSDKRIKDLVSKIPWLAGEMLVNLSFFLEKDDKGILETYKCPNSKCKQMFRTSIEGGKPFKVVCQKCVHVDEMNLKDWNRYAVDVAVVTGSGD